VNNGRRVACPAGAVKVTGEDETARLPYGRTRFFDAANGRSAPVRSHADCQAWVDGRRREPRS
jgi:ferric-dicitrate binding protein FerR (iron transport regulator)